MSARLTVQMTVNGRRRSLEVAAHHTLLDVLRDDLGLTGTKECCLVGECGACTVRLDGRIVDSCLVLAAEADGGEVTTIEGLAGETGLSRVQAAFLEAGGIQCGFCIPGQVMAADDLLRRVAHPTVPEIQEALAGNLCRCGGYEQITEAVLLAAGRAGAPAPGPTGPQASPAPPDPADERVAEGPSADGDLAAGDGSEARP